MVYCVDRTNPDARLSEVVIETASRSKAYSFKKKLEKADPECFYSIGMISGGDAGGRDSGPCEGFEEYISKTAKEILGME